VTRTVRIGAGAIAAALLLAACGDEGGGVSTQARDRLAPIIEQVRTRAAAHDAAGAEQALARLRDNVARFERAGEIGDDHAAAILQAARRVENRLTLITTTTTTTTVPPPPEPPDDGKEKGPGKDKGHEKGRGKGGKHGHDKGHD
jgi:hypothetical protein